MDYALTPEMQDVLRTAPEAPDPVTAPPGPSASLAKVRDPDTSYKLTKTHWYFIPV